MCITQHSNTTYNETGIKRCINLPEMGLGLNLNSGSSAQVILPSMCHLPALQMLPASPGPHRPPSAFQSLFQPGSCRHRKNQCPGREITPFTRGTKNSNLESLEEWEVPSTCRTGGISDHDKKIHKAAGVAPPQGKMYIKRKDCLFPQEVNRLFRWRTGRSVSYQVRNAGEGSLVNLGSTMGLLPFS